MKLSIIETDGFGALYVDGKLYATGPTYHVNEKLQEVLKVDRTYFDDFVFEEEKDFPETLEDALKKQEAFEEQLDDDDDDEDERRLKALERVEALEREARELRIAYRW